MQLILRTSEFWMGLFVFLGSFTVVKWGIMSAEEWTVIATSLTAYIVARITGKAARAVIKDPNQQK